MQDFGRFELQLDRQRLVCAGQPVPLGGRAFDLLVALWERRERVVGKDELIRLVWPSLVVEENNLQVQIGRLRKCLGAGSISTVPGRGYRFVGAAGPALPAPPERLHGRERSLAAVAALLRQQPLVTLVGAGGIGKTLLAQHLVEAHRTDHHGAAGWVDLGELTDPARVVPTLARSLGIDPGPGDPLPGLCTALSARQMLVVIDNAEHLLEEVVRVVRHLLRAAPALRLLVTSQVPLRLARECVHRLGALAVPDGPMPAGQALDHGAVALFDDRARSVDAEFVLTDGLAVDVIELCRQLDGSPLAIELAAARMPICGVHLLAGLLDDPLRLLTRPWNRDAPARQQTLRAGLQRSHDLLEAREQVVFRRLAVFAGSAPLDAIDHVVADAEGPIDRWTALDALGALVDRSLVATATAGDAAAPQYRLAHATRAFALERLAEAGEHEAVGRRHALWQVESERAGGRAVR